MIPQTYLGLWGMLVVSFRQLLYVVFNGERGREQRHQITVASLRKALIKAHLYYRPLYE